MKKLHNIEHIVSVELNEKAEQSYYKYFEAKSYWFWKNRKAGWYADAFGIISSNWEKTTIEQIETEYIIIGKECFEPPYVRVKLSNNDYERIQFKTYEECEAYVNKLRIKLNNKLIIL